MNEGTLRSVLYMMYKKAHLTLKEKEKKKMRREGGRVERRFLRPSV